jgi:hypothetical protein
MVLELKAPHDPTLAGLAKVLPTLLSYVLSFTIVAIYWLNHHHLIVTGQQRTYCSGAELVTEWEVSPPPRKIQAAFFRAGAWAFFQLRGVSSATC